VFWVMYAMFVMVGAGGLMATAQLAPIAYDYNIANVPVSILGLTLPALSFALTIDRMVNGACRPFFGWVSDHIGREHTMFLAFLLEGVGIYALYVFASNPIAFVVLSGLVFFAWGVAVLSTEFRGWCAALCVMIRAARLLLVHRRYPILTTTRPRTPPSTMRRPTSMTPDRSISLVIAASLPASMSDANRFQASRRRSSGHITESMPTSDTPRRMNGATVAGRSIPPANPQAATAPP